MTHHIYHNRTSQFIYWIPQPYGSKKTSYPMVSISQEVMIAWPPELLQWRGAPPSRASPITLLPQPARAPALPLPHHATALSCYCPSLILPHLWYLSYNPHWLRDSVFPVSIYLYFLEKTYSIWFANLEMWSSVKNFQNSWEVAWAWQRPENKRDSEGCN